MLLNKPKPNPKRKSLHVKKGDKVVVIAGQYKSEEPREVLKVDLLNRRVVLQGVNLRWKHQKPSQENPKGGRVQLEMPIDVSNVLMFSEKLGKGTRTRTEMADGKKVRVGTKCGTKFD
ncbi:MAG: 50S ribosomal protein L24 [Planctomycetota bacterium]